MKNPLQTFSPNLVGKDYVIGDMHGAWTVFEKMLEGLNFDKEKDRMFSVGDLVDRGRHSHLCLSLIREPWFHSVLSNHEQMMTEAFNGGWLGESWLQNGGMWGLEALSVYNSRHSNLRENLIPSDETQDLLDLIELTRDLPYVLTINMQDGKKYHILHAELPPQMAGKVTDEMLADPEKVKNIARILENQSPRGIQAILWARVKYYNFTAQFTDLSNVDKIKRTCEELKLKRYDNDNLSHIISGHTIVQKPLSIYNQTNLDTCAYGAQEGKATWKSLTAVCLNDWKFYQATHDTFRNVEPVEIK